MRWRGVVGAKGDNCTCTIKNNNKLKMDLPFDPAMLLLGIYLKETKTLIQKNICIPMFTAALVIIGKLWKQPKCPSIDEWIKQLLHSDYAQP